MNVAIPSHFDVGTREQSLLLATDLSRPLRFHARVLPSHALRFRLALQSLGRVLWANDTWHGDAIFATLDPVLTVHSDRVTIEAFSGDASAAAIIAFPMSCFEPDGPVVTGTTNVDFTAALAGALGDMRSSRETWLRIGPAGISIRTRGAGSRVEPKTQVPEHWVRGFLQLQAAMALPGTRLDARPVDIVAVVRYLTLVKPRLSPRALRYILAPGEHAVVAVEPYERIFPLKGADHGSPVLRQIRVWGRKRLRHLEPLLPHADRVRIYLKGRALPSFYEVDLGGGVTFTLCLTGWTSNSLRQPAGLDLTIDSSSAPDSVVADMLALLRERESVAVNVAAAALSIDSRLALAALARATRLGRATYGLASRTFRHRELFAEPIDEARYYPPDPRIDAASALRASGEIRIDEVEPRETRRDRAIVDPETGSRRHRVIVMRDWRIVGSAGPEDRVEAVLNEEGRLLFGRCGCRFFQDNLLNRGPCEHILAVAREGIGRIADAASSEDAGPVTPKTEDDAPAEE